MEMLNLKYKDLKEKKSKNLKVFFSETDELILLRFSAFNLNLKEIKDFSSFTNKQIKSFKSRIKRLMIEENWEKVILKAFRENILLFNDYTLSEVSSTARIYADIIERKMDMRNLQHNKITTVYDYREELFSFIEETKSIIKQNFKKKHQNSRKNKLSETELAYLQLITLGYKRSEILKKLKISLVREENFKRRIFRFLHVKNWFNAIRTIFLLDLIEMPRDNKDIIFNHIYISGENLSSFENLQYLNFKTRNSNIYLLLINLFNNIEFDILLNNKNLMGKITT